MFRKIIVSVLVALALTTSAAFASPTYAAWDFEGSDSLFDTWCPQ